jgi:enoyl-CoA hydratase/carnithine racemase
MLLHCDLVYAAESARFQLPFVNLALVPEAGSSYILPRLMGYQKSAELLLLGEPFNARQALEAGFVNAILPDEELHEKALQVADALASKPPSALRQTKALLKRGLERATAEAMKEEFALIAERLQSAEAKEAMQAFMERRQPDFSRFTGEECHPRPS